MDIAQFKAETTENVIEPMIRFIEEYDGEDYTKEDVQKCESLIHQYLEALHAMSAPTDDDIMEQVRIVVLALNDLNQATGYALIETDAREALWGVIQTSAEACGLQNAPDDVTEEWREW